MVNLITKLGQRTTYQKETEVGLIALIAIVISICFMAHYTQKQAEELSTLNSKLDQL